MTFVVGATPTMTRGLLAAPGRLGTILTMSLVRSNFLPVEIR